MLTDATATSLLADILEHPEDDVPRLILADWLDEHGSDHHRQHAELIRVQIALELLRKEDAARAKQSGQRTGRQCRHTYPEMCIRCRDLCRRERQLLVSNPANTSWAGPNDPLQESHPHRMTLSNGPGIMAHGKGVHSINLVFRRGLAAGMRTSTEQWLKLGSALLAVHPVERVMLETMPYPGGVDVRIDSSKAEWRILLMWQELDSPVTYLLYFPSHNHMVREQASAIQQVVPGLL